MNLYIYDIGERSRKVSRFIGHVRGELRKALAAEKASRKLTQQQIAVMIGTNRSVINREIMGFENLTVRRVAELAWALGWEIVFELRKPQAAVPQIIPNPGSPVAVNVDAGSKGQAVQVNAPPLKIIDRLYETAA